MKNRFNLEQDITSCWGICDDLRQALEYSTSEEEFRSIVEGLLSVYNMKFDVLFDTFKQVHTLNEYSPMRQHEDIL